jgi:hypothetical protein
MELAHFDGLKQSEFAGMIATLDSYENLFGPYHPQTLRLRADVALACWRRGELALARPLLERVARDVACHLGRSHEVRLRILATLRDLFLDQRDYEKAGAVQRELLHCQIERSGTQHPDAEASRALLASLLTK